jgi:signal transduction histidine kinase
MDLKDYPILYVDDEGANRVVMKHNLAKQFTLFIADSAEAALQILEREFVAVLLADQRMPGVTGVDLAEQTLRRYPDVVRVIITAYSDLEATIDAINRAHVNRFIKKPWTREELVAVMRESIQSFQTARLLKRMQERLIQLDRVTTVAVMALAIAHDLKQPIGFIQQNLWTLIPDAEALVELPLQPAGADEMAERILDGLQDISKGVEKFQLVSKTLLSTLRTQPREQELVDLKQVVEGALELTRSTVIGRARLVRDLPPHEAYVMASEGKVLQVIFNLVLNAVESLTQGTAMTNKVTVSLQPGADSWRITVQDTGCGIPADQQEKIFAPFHTTKERGTGLGLPICKQVVEELGGTLSLESAPGQGTCFTVELPERVVRPAWMGPEEGGGRG